MTQGQPDEPEAEALDSLDEETASDGDLAEQRRAVATEDGGGPEGALGTGDDVPEADAVEQRQELGEDEEYR